jgi:glc operon protein GlcG
VALQGGLPIEIEGQLVGAIGVSGVRASDDEIIAQAGLDALMAALQST